jgi:ribonuclease HII
MPDLFFENTHGRETGKMICGVDEVGRGPLAGPVVAAAVILPTKIPRVMAKEIRDSKKMSSQQRENIFDPLMAICHTSIAEASVTEIADLNILGASMLAMRRAVLGLQTEIHVALIDGNRCPRLACETIAIISGDDRSLSIAAASIIAKVTRDRIMRRLADDNPGYGWQRNVGYGTPEHLAALTRLGPTRWHRCDFAPVAQLLLRTK